MTEKAIFSHNNAMAQTTQASVGNGTITIGGQTLDKGNASELGLAMLNRDLAQAQRLTQDEAIGGLNFTTTIDGRWFSPEGRHEMADDQKKAGGALLGLGAKGLMAGGAAIGALTGAFKEDKALDGAVNVVKAVNAAEAYATKDAEGAATIDAYRDGQYSDLTNSQNATQKLAETMGADEDIRFTNVLTGMGVAGTTDGVNIYLDINGATRSDTVATLGHDVGHNLGIEKEWLAGVMGMATSMAFTAGLWQNADAVAAFRPVNTITADTLKANARLLATNNADFIEAFTDHPDEFENSLFVKDAPLYRAASKCLTQGCNPFTELGHQYKLDAQQNQLIAQLTAANLKQAGVEMVSGITAIPDTIQYIKEHPEVLKELPANLAADFKAALQQYGDDLAAIGAGSIVSDPASLEAQAQAEARLAAQLIQIVAEVGATAGVGAIAGKVAVKTTEKISATIGSKLDGLGEARAGVGEAGSNRGLNNFYRDDQLIPDDVAAKVATAERNGWKKADGKTDWPPYDGKVPNTEEIVVLKPGTVLDRFGGTTDKSSYLAPADTPMEMRALPPTTDLSIRDVYIVKKPLPVESSKVLPWFGKSGMGTQLETKAGMGGEQWTINKLVESGYLEKVGK